MARPADVAGTRRPRHRGPVRARPRGAHSAGRDAAPPGLRVPPQFNPGARAATPRATERRRPRSRRRHVDDYAAVRDLLAGILSDAVDKTVRPEIRELVELVATYGDDKEVQQTDLVAKLRIGKGSVSRRVNAALPRRLPRQQGGPPRTRPTPPPRPRRPPPGRRGDPPDRRPDPLF